MGKIFVLEDNEECITLLNATLNSTGISGTLTYRNIDEASKALEKINVQDIDLFLLDILLPDGDGLSFANKILSSNMIKDIPIIFLTAKDSNNDKIRGLMAGAEDYIVKPFDPIELKLRIEKRIENYRRNKKNYAHLKVDHLYFDLEQKKLYQIDDHQQKQQIDLTAFEFKLLHYLVENLDRLITRAQLLENIWTNKVNVLDRTVDSHISNLRKKMENTNFEIKSIYGEGYKTTIRQMKKKVS